MHRTSRVLVNLFGNTYTRSIYGNRPLILGIETSCDDTGAAVLSGAGKIYGEAISSQLGKHVSFGGVIPPLAAEMHRQNIEEVVTRALTEAQFEISDLDAISVTNRPGLPICLSVGLRYAKHLARKHKKPLIPVHHMKAHALMARIENDIDFPFLCLLVSGGHCLLAVAKDVDTFAFLGESQDNAPGEVFDKIARRLKLRNIPEMASFSGGQAVEIAASQAQNMAFEYPLPMARSRDCMFTFSGIMSKTYRYIKAEERKHGTGADEVIPSYRELSASALHSVIRHIAHRTHRAMIFIEQEGLIEEGRRTLVVSGGVACNNFLFEGLQQLGKVTGYRVFRPSKRLCTDNGVMIAWTGVEKYKIGSDVLQEDDFDDIKVEGKSPFSENLSDKVRNSNLKCRSAQIPILKNLTK